ncbi:hypothetical protein ACN27G_05335 [Plantactinospora sp. WMMB334]|uniref:hypothetical protein n=1 Tax=Plantactinospora sp. WMMB334 TaxID=3404119 RepID=UPI003B944432
MIGPWVRWERHAARRRLAAVRSGQHLPGDRYACLVCEHDWPCQDARLALLASFNGNRIGLVMYLAAHLTRALQALPDQHPGMVVGQILYWIPRRR